MANLNKETLRAACQDNPGQTIVLGTDDVLALLDEVARGERMLLAACMDMGAIGNALNADMNADGSELLGMVTDLIAENRALAAEVETLQSRLKACHPFRPAQEIKP